MRSLDKHQLHDALLNARQYTNAWLDDLPDAAWTVPVLPTINPPLWEWGHVVWFQERWCLRWRSDAPPAVSRLADADRWYDSSRVAHASRWTLDLPDREATRRYAAVVLDATQEALSRAPDSDDALYNFRLALYHEDMHAEALAYLRQTLALRAPPLPRHTPSVLPAPADLTIEGGEFALGAPRGPGFVFDNEKWSHAVALQPFAIAARPVTETEYAAFVDDGGYERPQFWSEPARAWLAASGAAQPCAWRRDRGSWHRRAFDRWLPISPSAPVVHVNAFEAEAYCAWAGRRLPTEAEWECAALSGAVRPAGVWEWTSTAFAPYPGFVADRYADYSVPWFATHRVMRGASAFTPPRLWHPRFRNFYLPARGDVFVGFRTCAC